MSIGACSDNGGVVPSGEQYAQALTHFERQNYANDHDIGRSTQDWRRDVFCGELAEVVAAAHLTDMGLDVNHISDEEDASLDLDVEGVRIDVKARYLWERETPDLIVRAITGPTADAYLMVELDKTPTGYTTSVTGWVSQEEVLAYGDDFLPRWSKHPKLLVNRQHLRDIDTLPDYLDILKGDSR